MYAGGHKLRSSSPVHLPEDKVFNSFLLFTSENLLEKRVWQYGQWNSLDRTSIACIFQIPAFTPDLPGVSDRLDLGLGFSEAFPSCRPISAAPAFLATIKMV